MSEFHLEIHGFDPNCWSEREKTTVFIRVADMVARLKNLISVAGASERVNW
jgi:hypothetical protein